MGDDAGLQATVSRIARELAVDLSRLTALADSGGDLDATYGQAASALDGCLNQLSALGLWGPPNRLYSSEIWNRCGHWLSRGWLQNQARTKPRGYAGDYLTLARIYRGELCDDPLGRHFDRYFQAQSAPRAVRNRMAMMADWIVEAAGQRKNSSRRNDWPLHIAVVGSAFGLEVRDAVTRLDESARTNLRFILLDLDPAACEFAEQQLQPVLAPAQLTAVAANLFRLPGRPDVASLLRGADLLFCPGLFDYLDDPAAAAMLRLFYEHLAPGGRLTVFQFAPHNPTRAYMEWLANWYLIYRERTELLRLVEAASLRGESAWIGAESLGVDLYLALAKT